MNNLKNNLDENPELKKMIFFGFYVIFFIFVLFTLRIGFNTNSKSATRSNSGYNKSFTLKLLKEENYHFNYKEIKNGNVKIYDGDVDGNKIKFVESGDEKKEYFKDNETLYIKNPNTLQYEKMADSLEFLKFLNVDNLENIFIHGTYTSKTEYFSLKEEDYNYEISTSTLLRYINSVEADLDDPANTVSVKLDADKKLYQISMDLTSFYTYYDPTIKDDNVVITFSKYGEIEPIRN